MTFGRGASAVDCTNARNCRSCSSVNPASCTGAAAAAELLDIVALRVFAGVSDSSEPCRDGASGVLGLGARDSASPSCRACPSSDTLISFSVKLMSEGVDAVLSC